MFTAVSNLVVRPASVLHHEPVLDQRLAADMGHDRQFHIPISFGIPFSVVCLPLLWRDGVITLLVELVRLVLVVHRELVV
jgi:hypothetical protein